MRKRDALDRFIADHLRTHPNERRFIAKHDYSHGAGDRTRTCTSFPTRS